MGSAPSRERQSDAVAVPASASASACPVVGNGRSGLAADAATSSSCPVPERYRSKAVYNVYNQRIDGEGTALRHEAKPSSHRLNSRQTQSAFAVLFDAAGHLAQAVPSFLHGDLLHPSNNMPTEPNQRPWAGQAAPLSTQRVQSTIPKGGTQDAWVYPSPQMFYNGECAERQSVLVPGPD